MADEAFVVELSPEVMAELDQVVAEQNKAPVPAIVLEPKHFELDAAAQLMAGVKRQLDDGLGFVILDRLPVDRWSTGAPDRHLLAARQPDRAPGGAGMVGDDDL